MHLSPRSRRVTAHLALPVAVVLSGIVVGTSSYAAFSDRTDNPGNAWASGKVAISDDDAGEALFDVAGLLPGDSGTACITVTSDTSAESSVRLYSGESTDADALADHLDLVVERGAATDDCSTFTAEGAPVLDGSLSDLMGVTSFADGLGQWNVPAGSTSSTYRFSYELDPAAPNTVQEATAATTFVWEAQND
jgi:hypothetical protein